MTDTPNRFDDLNQNTLRIELVCMVLDRETDVSSLREQVAALTKERDELRYHVNRTTEAVKVIYAKEAAQLATIATIEAERNEFGQQYISDTADLRATIAARTKERDEHKFYREQGAEDRDELTTQCARHLAVIETLHTEKSAMGDALFNLVNDIPDAIGEAYNRGISDGHPICNMPTGVKDITRALLEHADYAKKADEVGCGDCTWRGQPCLKHKKACAR